MAIQQNIILEQGTDFQATIKLYGDAVSPLNLTNFTGEAQMRRSYDSVSSTAVLTVSIPTPGNGEVVLSLAAASSTAIKYGRYLYDVVLTNNGTGNKSRAVEGIITVTPRVTR
jgi:hypothetical protein